MTNRYKQLFQILSSYEYYTQKRTNINDFSVYIDSLLNFQIWSQNNSEIKNAGYPISYVPGRKRELSYPFYETSGYMVQTLIKYQQYKRNEFYLASARCTLDWLLKTAHSDGSFPTNQSHFEFSSTPLIFDSGMILYGLIEGAVFFKDEQLFDLSKATTCWLNRRLDKQNFTDKKYTYSGDGHFRSYYIKVIHALLIADSVIPGNVDNDLCLHIYRHVLSQLDSHTLVKHTGFSKNYVHLHTLAYSIESLLKIAILIDDSAGILTIKNYVDTMFFKKLPASYLASERKPIYFYRCLVGEAQVAEIFYILHSLFNDNVYLDCADNIINDLISFSYKHIQSDGSYFYASHPSFGLYKPLEVVNWGAKFASDAILTRLLDINPNQPRR